MFFGELGAFAVGETVAEGAEYFVEWENAAAVITFEVAVVQVVKIGAGGNLVLNDWTFETVVAVSGGEAAVLQGEQEVQRVRRNHVVNKHEAEVEGRLDGVHRES